MKNNKHYAAIREFYGDQRAARSGALLIAHIDEGIALLDAIGSTTRAKEAFCIHPLLQDDSALLISLERGSILERHQLDTAALVLAMEYRRVANAYLAHHCQSTADDIELSCVPDVNQMLIADKVQNRKDFERFHLGTHPNNQKLKLYFSNWLRRLGISEERYVELCRSVAVPSVRMMIGAA